MLKEGWGIVLKFILVARFESNSLFSVPKWTTVNWLNWFLMKFPLQNNSAGFACLISFDKSVNASSALVKNLSSFPKIKSLFFEKIIVFDEIY